MYYILRHSSHYEYNFLHIALTALASRDDLECRLQHFSGKKDGTMYKSDKSHKQAWCNACLATSVSQGTRCRKGQGKRDFRAKPSWRKQARE